MNPFFIFLRIACKIILLPAVVLILAAGPALCDAGKTGNDSDSAKHKDQRPFNIREQLQVFYPLGDDADYTMTICADVPVNDKPDRVYKKGEPGHVFLILSKRDLLTGKTTSRSFGFYPRIPVTCLFKQARSKILDNCNREYDASLERKLSKEEFSAIVDKCRELAKKKYNLKKFNCYDYIIEIFNSLPGVEKLPLTKVKFPFILGRGGSPCGLYKDLGKLASGNSTWASAIRFGDFRSPVADDRQTMIASH
ncbi:MAG TPA: hypothetical protein VK489_00290 [Ferruginibacter sp.]|nr:hypothetical protein [Ferruginibacter sp.]